MRIRVNGEEREVRPGMVVRELLEELGATHFGVAVAIDGRVVPRTEHGTTRIGEGAAVEVIRAVGGG